MFKALFERGFLIVLVRIETSVAIAILNVVSINTFGAVERI
jgi:hypothetical protein